MTNKDTGGPAFPVHPDMADQLGCIPSSSDAGMTLCDYFAAKAMQALLSDPGWRHDMDFAETASAAYRQAAKMLKARDGNQ